MRQFRICSVAGSTFATEGVKGMSVCSTYLPDACFIVGYSSIDGQVVGRTLSNGLEGSVLQGRLVYRIQLAGISLARNKCVHCISLFCWPG